MKPFDRAKLAAEIEDALTRAAGDAASPPLRFDRATLHRLAESLAAIARHAADAHDALAAEVQQAIADLDSRIARLERERKP